MDQEFITNPISGARFDIIHRDTDAGHQCLETWKTSITSRLAEGNFVTLAMDCQGYMLGECANTGLSLQIGEIYQDNFNIWDKPGPVVCPPVGSEPGLIIPMPFDDPTATALRVILNHPQITLITFDFTADVAVLEENHVRVDLRRIIDCQLGRSRAPKGQMLTDLKLPGIFSLLTLKPEDPLFNEADAYLSAQPRIEWDAIHFITWHEGRSHDWFIDQNFLENAVSQITLIGLFCTNHIQKNGIEAVIRRSGLAGIDFLKKKDLRRGLLGGAITRRIAFHASPERGGKDYVDPPAEIGDEDEDIKKVLKIWRLAHGFEMARATCPGIVPGDPAVDRRRKEAAAQLLIAKFDAVKALAGVD
jgi:hypothetical protein